MAFQVDEEEEMWKCLKHPSNRRTIGVCPTCLRQRLRTLCPSPADSTSTSSSSSSLITGRMSTLIEREPVFRKSRSVTVPVLRSRSKYVGGGYDRESVEVDKKPVHNNINRSKVNFWSVFKASKTRKCDLHDDEVNKGDISGEIEDYSRMMRSRSVAVDAGESFSQKRRGWYLPSPMKAFRQSKTSPMHSGWFSGVVPTHKTVR